MRSTLTSLIAALGLLMPLTATAQSYYTPEQILQENNGAFLVPGHQRGAQWAAQLQTQQNMDRHPSIIHEPWDPVQDNGLPPPVALQEPIYDSAPQPQYQTLDPLTARLLARMERQDQLLLQSQFGYYGRPLANTGPAAILSVIAMIGATLWTIRRAKSMERFVREY